MSIENWTQTHGKLNGITFPHKYIIYNIIYRILEQVLKMASLNFQTCLIPGEQIIKYCLMILSRNCQYCAAAASHIHRNSIAVCTVHCNGEKYRKTISLLNRKRQQTRGLLSEETLDDTRAWLEASRRKSWRRLSQETGVSKSSVQANLQLCKNSRRQTARRGYGFVTGSVRQCVIL